MPEEDTLHPFVLRGHILVWAEWQACIWDEYTEEGETDLEPIEIELFDDGRFLPELEDNFSSWCLWYHDIEMGISKDDGFKEEGLRLAKEIRKIFPANIDVYYEDINNHRIKL